MEIRRLTDCLRSNTRAKTGLGGGIIIGGVLIAATVGMVVVGAYVGNFAGWGMGNIVDYLPIVRYAIPDAARSLGLNPDPKINENIFQAVGTLGGAGLGYVPWYAYAKSNRN